jgi:hypothetical protein
MKTWRDATHIHVCKHYVPGSWGKNSMDAAGRIGLNIDDIPEGMVVLCFTADRRMILIYYRVPGGECEMIKRYVDKRPGHYSIPKFLSKMASITSLPRSTVYGWIDNITIDGK